MNNHIHACLMQAPRGTDAPEVVITPLPLYHILALTANCISFVREGALNVLITNLLREGDVPRYEELPGSQGLNYKEVRGALRAEPTAMVRENDRGQLIVSVAVPVQRFKAVMGALLLSTEGGDIDALVRAERLAVLRVFVVLLVVTVLLAILLAGTIAAPVRRLADAAERVRRQRHTRVEIPDFRDRRDEIGELSGALREMTRVLRPGGVLICCEPDNLAGNLGCSGARSPRRTRTSSRSSASSSAASGASGPSARPTATWSGPSRCFGSAAWPRR